MRRIADAARDTRITDTTPLEASVTAASVTAGLDATKWDVASAREHTRPLTNRAGQSVTLRDVVVRATRRR